MCQPTILNKANASNLDWFEQPEKVSKSFTLEGHEYTDMGAAEVARPLFSCELLTCGQRVVNVRFPYTGFIYRVLRSKMLVTYSQCQILQQSNMRIN